MKGYQARSFDCELGSHFHRGHVSGGPPIIPDGRISQVRFETLAFLPWVYPASARLKRWFAYTPSSVVYPQPRSTTYDGLTPALSPATALTMEPPSVQSPFARYRCCRKSGRHGRLLRGHYSSVVARMGSCANPSWLSPPSAIASFEESRQVATSPCCQRDLPDVISANLSSDAWSLTTTGLQSACTCFFLRAIGLPQQGRGSAYPLLPANTIFRGAYFRGCRHSFTFKPPSLLPPRSFLPLRILPQGS